MLKIGWCSKDISTNKPESIPGQFHIRISKGVLDPVTVNALVLEGSGDAAIFLSCDTVSAGDGLIDEIRAEVSKQNAAIPTEKILFNATHTHCAPSHEQIEEHKCPPYGGIEIAPPAEYRAFLVTEAASAVLTAYESRTQGGVAYGYGYAVASHSRRVVYFDDLSKREEAINNSPLSVDGHASMYGNTNDPMFSGYEAGADHFVNLLYTFDADGRLTGAIINVPCPSQNSEWEEYLSADYWNEVRTALREKYGNIGIIAQCAAAGDLSPRILHYKKAQNRRYLLKYQDRFAGSKAVDKLELCNRYDIAERICQCFDEVLLWAGKDIVYDPQLAHITKTIQLEKRLITDEEYVFCRAELDKLAEKDFVSSKDAEADIRENTILLSKRRRFLNILKRYENQNIQKTLPMELHIIKIGELAFASNAFELYMDFQHRIQARSPFTQTFVVQLCAQPKSFVRYSYLATRQGIDNLGYSATMFCNLITPEGGQTLVEETLTALNEIHLK